MRIMSVVLLGGLLIVQTGCVSTSRYQSDVSDLQTQLTQTQAALAAQQERSRVLEAQLTAKAPREAYQGATYRTASGFEIPAKDIQKALKQAGYYAGAVDGKMGPDAREALRNFQRDKGLTVDGVCGRQTWNKLKESLITGG